MIKARIRWCTCRVENILTLGKLLGLWFCFLLHSILFLISQTSYRIFKIISSYELARPVMGTIFLVVLHDTSIPLSLANTDMALKKIGGGGLGREGRGVGWRAKQPLLALKAGKITYNSIANGGNIRKCV